MKYYGPTSIIRVGFRVGSRKYFFVLVTSEGVFCYKASILAQLVTAIQSMIREGEIAITRPTFPAPLYPTSDLATTASV